MSRKNVKILGTGCYLPKKQITAEDLEKKTGFKTWNNYGWLRSKDAVLY